MSYKAGPVYSRVCRTASASITGVRGHERGGKASEGLLSALR